MYSFTVKPFFNKEPSDIVSVVGQRVLFECSVGGEPNPNVLWRREDGKMPVGRAQILDDKSLRIDNVQAADEGLYICSAENNVGGVTARATLVVNCKLFCLYFCNNIQVQDYLFVVTYSNNCTKDILINIINVSRNEMQIQQI